MHPNSHLNVVVSELVIDVSPRQWIKAPFGSQGKSTDNEWQLIDREKAAIKALSKYLAKDEVDGNPR